jgi:hypothetical protein
MNYFGTDLRQAGHYFWDLIGEGMSKSKIYFQDIPFDPYDGQKPLQKGTVTFKNIDGFSVAIISGSCTDGRNGTVSTFFVKETISLQELKERILSIPIAKKIIEQMPFEVNWYQW